MSLPIQQEELVSPELEEEDAKTGCLRLLQENEASSVFRSRAKLELQKLRSVPVFSKAYIRIKFPDMHIFQATFSPSESMAFVYQFLKSVRTLSLRVVSTCG